jgi:hypothetical protein
MELKSYFPSVLLSVSMDEIKNTLPRDTFSYAERALVQDIVHFDVTVIEVPPTRSERCPRVRRVSFQALYNLSECYRKVSLHKTKSEFQATI